MDIEKIKSELLKINWEAYSGPRYYEPARVVESLTALADLADRAQANEVGNKVTNAIGNDHSGTYYPAVLSALDIIASIEKASPVGSIRRVCAGAILNNLYYFEPELGGYGECSAEDLKKFVRNKLEPYSDG